MVLRLVGYVRVSSDAQKDNTSLEVQRERVAAYCVAQGHELFALCWDVQSGATAQKNRPGFREALSLVLNDKADGIIAMKLDRFARNVQEGLRVASDLNRRGKQLVLLDCNMDTSTPIGKCIFTVLLAFAQLERETIIARCQSGIDKKIAEFGYAGGKPPYGFACQFGELVPVPEELIWRKRIISWHSEGIGVTRIAGMLNQQGIRNRAGRDWTPGSIRHILNNRVLAQWYEEREHRLSERAAAESAG